MKDERPLTTNGSKDDQEKERRTRIWPRGRSWTTIPVSKYRSDVARLNYLAWDRPDIAFSVNEHREAYEPSRRHWMLSDVRRLVRYLKFRTESCRVATDTKNTQGVCKCTLTVIGQGAAKRESQPLEDPLCTDPIILKGCPRPKKLELCRWHKHNSTVLWKTAAETIGIVSIFQDINMIVKGRVLCDASAALGIVRRKGVGKTRHIDTGLLWIQQKNESKGAQIRQGTRPSQPRRHVHQSSCE